jgi:hypothetical protein
MAISRKEDGQSSGHMKILHIKDIPCVRVYKTAFAVREACPNTHTTLLTKGPVPERFKDAFDEIRVVKELYKHTLADMEDADDFDICHVHNTPNCYVHLPLKAGMPFVFDFHDLHFHEDPDQELAWNSADACLVPCQSLIDMLTERYGERDGTVKIIQSRVNRAHIPKLADRRERKPPFRIVYGGSFYNKEFAKEIVAAFPNTDMDLYCNSVLTDVVKPLIKKKEKVVLHKAIQSYTDYLRTLQVSDFGLLPTTGNMRYSMPNKLFEYIVCALPILVDKRLGDVIPFLEEWDYPHIKYARLPSIKKKVQLSEEQYSTLYERALQFRHKFTMEMQAAEIMALYEEAIG